MLLQQSMLFQHLLPGDWEVPVGAGDSDSRDGDSDSRDGHTANTYGHSDRDTDAANSDTRAGCNSPARCRRSRAGIPQQAADAQEPESETNELKFGWVSRSDTGLVTVLAGWA